MYFYARIELRVLPRTKQRWKAFSTISSSKGSSSSSPSSGEEDEEKEKEKPEKYLLQREQSYGTDESHKKLDLSYYASLLNSMNTSKSLRNGRFAHHMITHIGLDPDTFVGSHVVLMYGTCGALDDAFHVFENFIERRSIFSWNFIVRAFARHDESEKVLFFVGLMQQQGVFPSKVTFVSVFDACSLLSTINVGLRMHSMIVGCPFEMDVVIATALVNMYGKFGRIEIAMCCFDLMREQDVIAWTALISAFLQCGKAMEARSLFDQMMQEAWMPNEVSFISLFDACEDLSSLGLGKQVHVRITCNHSVEAKLAVANALVNMYGKCGCLLNAKMVFKKMEEHNLVTWTSMISAYSQNGHHKEAIQHFLHLQQIGMMPDRILFSAVLSTCGNSRAISLCKQMHAIILCTEDMVDVFLGTILVNTYGKCRNMEHAQSVFHSIADKNIFSWNAMISAYSQNGCNEDAYHLFGQMHEEAIFPNNVTFLSIVNSCANDTSGSAVKRGAQIHACVMQLDIDLQNALIDMYGKCNRIDTATSIFNDMSKRDSITWNAIIGAYTQHGEGNKSFAYFDQMWQGGVQPDKATYVTILSACMDEGALTKGQKIHATILESGYECDVMVATAIVSMYGRCKSIHDAQAVFGEMNVRNEVSWNAMIAVYEHLERLEYVLELFNLMQQDGVLPDHITLVTVLSACVHNFAIAEGKMLHAYIIESGYNTDVVLNTSILNMYGKLGSVYDAQKMFEMMKERNTVSWNTMIAISTQHGSAMGAFGIFSQMQADGVTPNKITFINVFGACSHSGILQEAYQCFNFMMETYLVFLAVDHYICFIDLLGRIGRLQEAEIVINNMPLQPSAVSFMALLGACRYRDDLQRAERAANHVFELEPKHYASHLVLSSIYSSVDRAVDGGEVGNIVDEFHLHDFCLRF